MKEKYFKNENYMVELDDYEKAKAFDIIILSRI